MKSSHTFKRITISIPLVFSSEIETIQKELNISKSELFKMSFEKFSNDYKKQKLKDIAEMMKDEYINNKDLTSFLL